MAPPLCTQTNFHSQTFGNACATNGLPLEYIEHTQTGTRPGAKSPVTFEFDWTPPATNAGDLILYVAANGANGDNSERGDHIYTARYTVTQLVGPSGLFPGPATVPAKPGDVIIPWGTGFGATNPAVVPGSLPPANQVCSLVSPVSVTIGDVAATVIGAALAPGNAGLYQIAVQVPASVPGGDQTVIAQLAGMQSPSNVLLSVKR